MDFAGNMGVKNMQKKKMLVQAAAVLGATALSASPVLAAGWQEDADGGGGWKIMEDVQSVSGSGLMVTMMALRKAIILAIMAICT